MDIGYECYKDTFYPCVRVVTVADPLVVSRRGSLIEDIVFLLTTRTEGTVLEMILSVKTGPLSNDSSPLVVCTLTVPRLLCRDLSYCFL